MAQLELGRSHPPRTTLGDGRYELHEPVGIGGTATVWRAFDRRLQVDRAAKVLHDFIVEDPSAVSRFLDEARTLARLEHPHVVRIYDLGNEGGRWYCVMSLLPDNLGARVRRAGKVPPLRALCWTFELLLALDAAHRLGVLHRDVRPANVLLGPDQGARLADFGVARLKQRVTGVTVTGESVGDQAWIAPEQRDDPSSVGPTADLYAAGTVLLYLVTGQTPRRPLQGDLRDTLTGLPGPIQDVLWYAICDDPQARWPHAAAMIASVCRAHDDLASRVGEPPRGEVWREQLDAQRAALEA